MKITSRDVDRFISGIDKTDNCWNWNRSVDTCGYGMFYCDGKQINSHRFSYLYFNGDIPDGLVVRHICDNTRCVNPEHLVLGTNSDNLKDSYARRRRNSSKVFEFNNGNCKLSDSDVLYIRNYSKYYGYRKDLAKFFGVSIYTIEDIVSNKRRRCVGNR